MNHSAEGKRADLIIVNKEKNTCQVVNSAVPLKENEKLDKYLSVASEMEKVWSIMAALELIVVVWWGQS